MNQRIFSLATLMLGLFGLLVAQSSLDELQQPVLQSAVCVWDGVAVKDGPGTKGKSLGSVYFGETVEVLGPTEEYTDKRIYMLVRTADKKEGWVHEYLFVKNGVVGVVTADMPVYKKPNSATTVTGTQFVAGDVVVMDQAEGDWVHLVTRRKERMGWAKAGDNITFEQVDIEAAAMIHKAEKDTLPEVRVARLKSLQNNPIVTKSSLGPLVAARIAANQNPDAPAPSPAIEPSAATRGMAAARLSQQAASSTPPPANARIPQQQTSSNGATARIPQQQANAAVARVSQPTGPTLASSTIADINTGNTYTKTVEEGKVLEVAGPPGRASELFCYHKTLPLGAEVFLTIPDNGGYVKLRVADRLGNGHPEIIAMSAAGMRALFGTTTPDRVQIVYYQPIK